MDKRNALGKGLSALIPDAPLAPPPADAPVTELDIEALAPNDLQPRLQMDEARLEELAASIRSHGVIQPIVVRKAGDGYRIIAGERRWRAAKRAGLTRVPVVVKDVGGERASQDLLELALIENIQREDLNPIDEAKAYRRLADEFRLTQDAIAGAVGKDRATVANTLRLLKLSDTVKAHIRSGKLSAGHARMLIGAPDADALAEEIITRALNVRQVEAIARERAQTNGKKRANGRGSRTSSAKSADTLAFEKRISDATGLVVSIEHRDDHGTLTIRYRSLDQLDDLVQRLVRGH